MAENIADLVDGYYKLFTNTDASIWDRTSQKTPSNSATNSLEKSKQKTTSPVPDVARNSDSAAEFGRPMLNEDYAEIGIGEEEADYSTPASKCQIQ